MGDHQTNYRDLAFEQIDAADLTATLFKAAIRLLLNVENDGHLKATKERVCELCSTMAWGTARRLLGVLKAANVLHYSTDGDDVYLNFYAWPAQGACSDFDHTGSEFEHPGSEIDHAPADACSDFDHTGSEFEHDSSYTNGVINNCAPTRENRASMINIRANDAGGKGLELGRVESLTSTPDQLGPNSTPPAGHDDLDGDGQWVYNLLTDPEIAIMPENAITCARLHTPAYVVRYVGGWWPQRSELGVGALVWRMMNWKKSKPGPAPPAFLASDLYWRHYPLPDAEEVRRWRYYQRNGEWIDLGILQGMEHLIDRWPPDLMRLLEQIPEPADVERRVLADAIHSVQFSESAGESETSP